jgi:hypothetical protein
LWPLAMPPNSTEGDKSRRKKIDRVTKAHC